MGKHLARRCRASEAGRKATDQRKGVSARPGRRGQQQCRPTGCWRGGGEVRRPDPTSRSHLVSANLTQCVLTTQNSHLKGLLKLLQIFKIMTLVLPRRKQSTIYQLTSSSSPLTPPSPPGSESNTRDQVCCPSRACSGLRSRAGPRGIGLPLPSRRHTRARLSEAPCLIPLEGVAESFSALPRAPFPVFKECLTAAPEELQLLDRAPRRNLRFARVLAVTPVPRQPPTNAVTLRGVTVRKRALRSNRVRWCDVLSFHPKL